MNIPENVDSDFLNFLNNSNIYSLNRKIEHINKINNEKGTRIWTTLQKKELLNLITELKESYPVNNVPDYIKENSRYIISEKCKEFRIKIAKENKKYIINKELYLQLINEKKEILMNETKNKEKQKALEDITCECGLLSKRKNIAAHRKSTTHIKLMAITKETPLCPIIKETPINKEKEEKQIEKEFKKIAKEHLIDEDSEDSEDETDEEEIEFTEEQIKQFRIKNNLIDDYELLIKKNYIYRKKWNIDDNILMPMYKKENGFTVMPQIIIGIF